MAVGQVVALAILLGLMLDGCASDDEALEENDDNQEFKGAIKNQGTTTDTPWSCNACVICTNATDDSIPVHMKNVEGLVHLEDVVELNKTIIEMEENFKGCKKASDGKCKIVDNCEAWIEDRMWQDVDETKNQGIDKQTLHREKSYMFCKEYAGIIYFYNDGQEVKP